MRKTKIVCTVGPACNSKEMLLKMIDAGMNVARVNMSHGSQESLTGVFATIREAIAESGKNVAIMIDTKGPEVRVATFEGGSAVLEEGSEFTLYKEKEQGDSEGVAISYPKLVDIFRRDGEEAIGRELLLDDGLISIITKEVLPDRIVCTVNKGGKLSNRKSINIPGYHINMPYVSSQDRRDIEFGLSQGGNVVAASFVRNHEDVRTLRDFIDSIGYEHVEIIAKIENQSGVDDMDLIIDYADGIMVARGDLGVEVPAEDVPLIQKEIIRKCNKAGKPVIVATQMLESMTSNPRPTRAEVSDVGNAILDGTDAIMLSGETAQGDYPVEAVATMNRIAQRIESSLEYKELFVERGFEHMQSRTRAVAHATVQMAWELDVPAIITPTDSGYTTKVVSRYRPKAAIVAYTPHEKVVRQLNLRWGVYPILGTQWNDVDEMIANAASAAVKGGYLKRGDTTIITSGIKLQSKTSVGNNTNMIRVYQV